MASNTENNTSNNSLTFMNILNSRMFYAVVSVVILLSMVYVQARVLDEVDKIYLRKAEFNTYIEADKKFQDRVERTMDRVLSNQMSLERIKTDVGYIKQSIDGLHFKPTRNNGD